MCERGPWNIMHQAEGSGTEFQEQLLDFLGRVKANQIKIPHPVNLILKKKTKRPNHYPFLVSIHIN